MTHRHFGIVHKKREVKVKTIVEACLRMKSKSRLLCTVHLKITEEEIILTQMVVTLLSSNYQTKVLSTSMTSLMNPQIYWFTTLLKSREWGETPSAQWPQSVKTLTLIIGSHLISHSQACRSAASASVRMTHPSTHSCRLVSAVVACMSCIFSVWRHGSHARKLLDSLTMTKWLPTHGKHSTVSFAKPSTLITFPTLLLKANGLAYLRYRNLWRIIWF